MVTDPIERSYSLLVAEATLINALESLGYCHDFQMAGRLVFACRCIISDKKTGAPVASGNGKGELLTARVGSLFEATEHLFSDYKFIARDKISYLNSAEFCRNNKLCESLPLALVRDLPNGDLPFLTYTSVNGSQSCFYPLALSCPSYIDALAEGYLATEDLSNYERLEHYSSNSGTAIGMNCDEAIVHGLLEDIERTSLSNFLTSTFLPRSACALRKLDPSTLPNAILDVLGWVEGELGGKLLIFEMPNKFGVPAYCSWMDQKEFAVGFAGFGCSLSVEHAVLRSLHELAQYFLLGTHIYGTDWLKALDTGTLTALEGFPFHQQCARFNLGSRSVELGYELVDYRRIQHIQFHRETNRYLSDLTDIIYNSGEVPYASELNVIGSGIHVAHTFITGEDRFHTVRLGKVSFPVSLPSVHEPQSASKNFADDQTPGFGAA